MDGSVIMYGQLKTKAASAGNAYDLLTDRPIHARRWLMAKSSLSNCPQSIPNDTTEYVHPLIPELFPHASLDPEIAESLREMDENALTALLLFHDAIIEGIMKAHGLSHWDTDNVAEMTMSWVYHRYPEVVTDYLRIGLDGRAFEGPLAAYEAERTRMESQNEVRRDQIRVGRLRRMPYADYLQTDHWQRVRRRALASAGDRCQLCNADKSLHVHHRTYERRGEEEPGDLIVLCASCHQHFHDKLKVQS